MRTLQIDGFKVCGCSNWRLCERFKLVYYASAGWSSLVARWAHNPKVAGSNPAPATTSATARWPFHLSYADFPLRIIPLLHSRGHS